MKVGLHLIGQDEVRDRLKWMAATMQGGPVVDLFHRGASMVAARIAALAPVDKGGLKKSWRAVASSRHRPEGFATSANRGGDRTNVVKKRTRRGSAKKKAWYARFVEEGHRIGKRATNESIGIRKGQRRTAHHRTLLKAVNDSRAMVPPQPFVAPAVEQSRDEVLAFLRQGIEQIMQGGKR